MNTRKTQLSQRQTELTEDDIEKKAIQTIYARLKQVKLPWPMDITRKDLYF